MVTFTDAQDDYLSSPQWAALATGRKDGSPQLSQIVYAWNGEDIVISVKSYTAKWKNALREPKVALLIHDGRRQLVDKELIHEMTRSNLKKGLVTLCIGGGMGISMCIERD